MAFKIESSLLDACALAILNRGDTYGYEITQSMKQAIIISESTLYPVLRRLQKENLCKTYDEPYQGRNRRYYSITEEGKIKLKEYQTQWKDYKFAIETFLNEADSDEVDNAAGADEAVDRRETEGESADEADGHEEITDECADEAVGEESAAEENDKKQEVGGGDSE